MLVGIGIFCGFVIAIFEFMWNVRQVAVKEKITPWEAFKNEAKFALQIHIRTKPVRNYNASKESSVELKSRSGSRSGSQGSKS